MKKKVVSVLLCATMAATMLAGCGNTADNSGDTQAAAGDATAAEGEYNYDITVWVPEAAVDLTQQQIEDFNSSNEDGITFNATIEAVSEADAATTAITDVEAEADIFFFAQDQAARLVQAGALSKLGEGAQATVSEANDAGVVAAAMSGDEMYCYPLTSDNGYFMYYDKSVVADEDVDDLWAVLADCETANRTFCMETDTSAWYIASFFFGTGCSSTWETDDDGNFISVSDDWNSANGLIAAKAIYQLTASDMYISSSSASEFAGHTSTDADGNEVVDSSMTAAVVISGTWDKQTAMDALGDNFGVADLPSFDVDGTSYHMGSYNGCKLLGVKPQEDAAKSACLHKLAQYLTGEDAQMERFSELGWGPANLVDQQSEEVQADPTLAALYEQNVYSVPQGQIHGSWWDIAKVIGTDIEESDGSDEQLQAALDKYEETMAGLFTMSDEAKNAFTVIGSMGGDGWATDIEMTSEDGITWVSGPIEMVAGDQFKVRQGASWDVCFGDPDAANADGNCECTEDGTYVVTLVYDEAAGTGVVTMEKQ